MNTSHLSSHTLLCSCPVLQLAAPDVAAVSTVQSCPASISGRTDAPKHGVRLNKDCCRGSLDRVVEWRLGLPQPQDVCGAVQRPRGLAPRLLSD